MGTRAFQLGDVTFDVPAGYSARTVVLSNPDENVTFGDPEFSRSVVLTRESVGAGVTAEQYRDAQLALMKASLKSFQLVKTGTLIIDGVECPTVEVSTQVPSGIGLSNLVAYLVVGGTAFCLTASHVAGKRFEGARAEFVALFQSLRVSTANPLR